MILSLENILLIGSLLLFFSIIASKTSARFGVPVLLLFLIIGMLAGVDGIGGIAFNNSETAKFIGILALSIILFSGGMDTQYSEVRPVIKPGMLLATLGVLLTACFTGIFIFWVTNIFFKNITLSFTESLLLASVMSSTDSASVFAILRSKGLRIKHNLRPLLEFESGSNDPMAYMLMVVFMQLVNTETQNGDMSMWMIIGMFLYQLFMGIVLGYWFGKLTVFITKKINLDNHSLYPVLLLTMAFIIFAFTDVVKGNGYLAVYIGGLVVGNEKFVHKRMMKNFFDGFAWLAQIVMFLTLGLLVNPHELLPIAGLGLLIAVFMIVFSRPISIILCLLPFNKMPKKAKHFVAWVGLRGAVPIIFATYLLTSQIPNARLLFNIVFFITIVSLLVQGSSVSFVAHKLGLADKEVPKQIVDAEDESEKSQEIL